MAQKRSRTIILPFTGKVFEHRCHAIRKYYDLHSQCTNKKPKQKDYCLTCCKHIIDGKPAYGDIRDRLNIGLLDYVDPFGKMTVPFHKVMKRMKITKEEALAAAEKEDVVIPDIHWGIQSEPTVKQPKPIPEEEQQPKEPDEQPEETNPKPNPKPKPRGRPLKNVNIINECDIIESSPDQDKVCSILLYENHEYLLCSSTKEVFDIDTEVKIGMYISGQIEFC